MIAMLLKYFGNHAAVRVPAVGGGGAITRESMAAPGVYVNSAGTRQYIIAPGIYVIEA